MTNKTGLKREKEILDLFYQYSLNGLQEPVATNEDLKAKMRGDLREFISDGVSTRTDLYLLECFGSDGYALSYIRSGQDRGDFSILRAWIPTIFQYNAKDLVSFLKETLDTLERLAFKQTAELPKTIIACASKFNQYRIDRTTRRLFSQIETEPRGSKAPYAWCWLEKKSIEKVIQDYIPQSNFGQYRGIFFVDTQSAPQEFSPGLAVIKEEDLKPVITIPTLSPRLALEVEKWGIKPGDFKLSQLTIDSTTINLSDKDSEQFECWKGAEVKASWQFKSKAFAPIVKRAKVQSEQGLEKLTLIQAGDVKRRFSKKEFLIIDKTTNAPQTESFKPQPIKRGLRQGEDIFSKEFSLSDFHDGPLSISFKANPTKHFKPDDSIDLKINIDHFLNPIPITASVVEVRLSKIRFEVEVCSPAKKYSSDAQIWNELARQIKSLSTDSFDIKVASSSTPPAYNVARDPSSIHQRSHASSVAPSSMDDLEEHPRANKRHIMKWINLKWVNLATYICTFLFLVSLVLVFSGFIHLQWGAKSDKTKEEQATQVDRDITPVDSLQDDLHGSTTELSKADTIMKDSIRQAVRINTPSSNKDAGKLSNKGADKHTNKDADKHTNKDAGKLRNKDAGKLSCKASNGSNTRQRKSTPQKQTK